CTTGDQIAASSASSSGLCTPCQVRARPSGALRVLLSIPPGISARPLPRANYANAVKHMIVGRKTQVPPPPTRRGGMLRPCGRLTQHRGARGAVEIPTEPAVFESSSSRTRASPASRRTSTVPRSTRSPLMVPGGPAAHSER
ncbi:MAG: hypothetical protein AVDCRST_MAG50-225, partial [uncultured Acidimicrobiales bacterium]